MDDVSGDPPVRMTSAERAERDRLAELFDYEVLDTPPEPSFDRLVELAARLCATPMAVITLVDERRQWFKASVGVEQRETDRAIAFCAHAIEHSGPFVVTDALADVRFEHNPLVLAEPHIRFYHGVSLISPDGHALGTLAVLDRVPRELDPVQAEAVAVLAEQVMVHLEHRRQARRRDALVVELDEAHQRAERAAEHFRELFENNPRSMWIYDVETLGFLAVNDAAVRRYGYSRDEFLTMSIADIRPAEDIGQLRISTASAGPGMSSSGRWRHVRSDGSVIAVEITSHSLVFEGREARLVHAQDVTAQQLAERRAEALTAELRRVFEVISDAFLAVDRSWHYTFVNEAAGRMVRRPAADLIGTSLWDASPRLAEVAGDRLRAAMEHRTSDEFVLDALERDRWAEVRVYPSPDGLWLFAHDITHQRLAEEVLRLDDERFRIVAAAATDAIYDWNLRTNEVWRSEGMEQLFGHQSAAVDGINGRIHPDDRERVIGERERFVTGTAARAATEYRFERADGSYAVVLDQATVIRADDGTALRLIGGITDVTARRDADERLHRSQRLEAIGQLTGGVAHDFNNLLTVILGNSEMLVDELESDDLRSMAEMTRDAALRGAELSRRLLAFARRQPLEPRGTDVNHLVVQLDVLLRRALPESIDLELVRGAGLWPAFVDSSQLEGALLNLCLNARDAMPDGGRLTIETANARIDQDYADRHDEVEPGQYVLVAVSDTGTGIESDVAERVFEPFFTTKANSVGTGLGLSMVHGFVKQSRGHVKLYSEVGEGTTFRMYLPRAASVDITTTSLAATALPGGSESILLVEDDELVRQLATGQLLGLGYEVVAVGDGHAALEVIGQRDDLVLLFTDVVMPGGMSGRQLADRALELRPELRVLYTSGYTENAIVHQGRLDPGVQLLTKPYRLEELARRVRSVLDGTG